MGVRQPSPGDRRAGPRPGPTLQTEDGVALATTCWLADAPSPATVVICHGFTANKADPKVVALAELLYAGGHEVITYDARGHGDSGGTCTLGKLEGLDVAAVVEWAATRGNPVVLIGASIGAVAALSYAADHDSLAGVIAISSPGDWRLPLRVRSLVTAGIARTRLGRRWARRTINVRIGPWEAPDPARSLLEAVRCPVVVVHGSADPIIPTNFSLANGFSEGPLRELVVVPGMGHALDPVGLTPICDAIDRILERGSESSGQRESSNRLVLSDGSS
jgi:pimeloyl-ACP methyl ester carboxylesterase